MNDNDKTVILHKELDLIQSCITRMAQNSFTIKGWYFALIVVISAWKFNNSYFYSCTLIVATMIFYILNLQFYIYERRYRELYNERLKIRCVNNNYVDDLYSLAPITEKFKCRLFFSKYIWENKMLLFMYFGICGLLIIANLLINVQNNDRVNIEEENINIEIEGLKKLLNSIEVNSEN